MRVPIRILLFLTAVVPVLLFSGCTLEKLFPDLVANGAARLTVNNLGNLMVALHKLPPTDSRPECDFRSRVLIDGNSTIEEGQNGQGKVTWKFENCEFDFGPEGKIVDSSTNCGPQKTSFFGKVVVSGTRSTSGILTGNASEPVIPSGPEGINFSFTKAVFHGYRVESTGLDKAMTIDSGSCSFDAHIHLAKSEKTRICEIPLPNLTISNIKYSAESGAPATLITLPGIFGNFQAEINGSDINAQVGVYQGLSNHLSGKLTVWGNAINVPTDDPGLNPNFTAKAYEESLSCTPDLQLPVKDVCPFEEPTLATGVGKLTVLNIVTLVRALNEQPSNTPTVSCQITSLSSPPTKVELKSRALGEATWEFADCEYDFLPGGTVIQLSGDPGPTKLFGKVKLSGKRQVTGFITDDENNPVVPGSGGVKFRFDKVTFSGFRVESPLLTQAMTMTDAELSFDLHIHLAKNKESGLCTEPLPNLTLDKIKYLRESTVIVPAPFGDFRISIDDSDFRAQLYRYASDENHIEGRLRIFGVHSPIPQGPDEKLMAEYESADYENALTNMPQLQQPVSSDCDGFENFETNLATNVARLSVNNIGYLIKAINQGKPAQGNRVECNLGDVEQRPTRVVREGKTNGEAIWDFTNCEWDFGSNGTSIIFPDSKEPTLYFGKVTLSGSRRISGTITDDEKYPVLPGKERAFKMRFSDVRFSDFRVEPPGLETPMTFVSGSASFDLIIHLVRDPETQLYTRPRTDNPTFKNIRFSDRSVAKIKQGSSDFKIIIGGSHLLAQVGHFEKTNYLEGVIKLFGSSIEIPKNTRLDPDPNYKAPAEPEDIATEEDVEAELANFQTDLATNFARLGVNTVGNLVRVINSGKPSIRNPERCKLDDIGSPPSRTESFGNGQGEVSWTFENCEWDFGVSGTPILFPDSDPKEPTIFFGKVTVSGIRSLAGTLTSDLNYPVLPGKERAFRIKFSNVDFQHFRVETPKLSTPMTVISGSASFELIIHLMNDPQTGYYTKPNLSNPTFRNIKFSENTIVTIRRSKSDNFRLVIADSEIQAQVGLFGNKQNEIWGSVKTLEREFTIPPQTALDPDPNYVRQSKEPDTTKSGDPEVDLVDGLARLTVNNFAKLLLAFRAVKPSGAQCIDFGSLKNDSLNPATVVGAKAGKGIATWEIKDCTYDFGRGVKIDDTTFLGRVTLTGKRLVSGYLTHDLDTPVVPSADGIELDVQNIIFEDYQAISDNLEYSLKMISGTASYNVTIHLAKSESTSLCTIPIANPTFKSIRYNKGAVVAIHRPDSQPFRLTVENSDINAQAGIFGNKQNELIGYISTFGTTRRVPSEGSKLSPNFDENSFSADERTKDDLVWPISYQCASFEQVQALNIARLLMLNVGTITQEAAFEYLKKDKRWTEWPNCGFSSYWVRGWTQIPGSKAVIGNAGELGKMVFTAKNCDAISQEKQPGEFTDDCRYEKKGIKTMIEGKVTLSGTQTVTGIREDFPCFDYSPKTCYGIRPNSPNSMVFDLTEIYPVDFSSYYVSDEHPTPQARLKLNAGKLTAKVKPVLTAKPAEPCRFERSTPVARFDVKVDEKIGLEVELDLHTKEINFSNVVVVQSANLQAQNGVYQGKGNFIQGSITIGDVEYKFRNEKLNPDYDQEEFDSSYACRVKKAGEEFAIDDIIHPEVRDEEQCDAGATVAKGML